MNLKAPENVLSLAITMVNIVFFHIHLEYIGSHLDKCMHTHVHEIDLSINLI